MIEEIFTLNGYDNEVRRNRRKTGKTSKNTKTSSSGTLKIGNILMIKNNEMELCYYESSLFKKFTFEVLGKSYRS